MNTKNIVKGVSLVLIGIGLLTIVTTHPALVALIVVGCAGFYVGDKVL